MRKYILLIIFLCVSLIAQSQSWSSVGDIFFNDENSVPAGFVFSLKKIDNKLYVGGAFRKIGGMNVNSIAIWDGVKWDSLNSAITGGVSTICKFNNELYIGGQFYAGAPNTGYFAKWNGTSWSAVGSGISNSTGVNTLVFKNKLFIGGGIYQIGSISPNHIAGWDGSNYSGLAGGVTGMQPSVDALCVYNDELIVGGIFDYAGSTLALNIASWDGTNWKDLQTGVSGRVYSLVVDSINNSLYVGGGYYYVGTPPGILSIALSMWDGYTWKGFGENPPERDIYALAMYNNNLYMGVVSLTGLVTDTVLIKYNGINWEPILGPNSTIKTLEVYNDELYVGGGFNMVGLDTMIGIARYHEPPDTVSCTFIQPLIHAMPFGTKEVGDTIKTTPPYHIQFYTNNKYASSWAWDFGDGNTANTRMPAHTYAAPGTYNVTLEVIHPHNLSSQVCTLNVSKTITIIDNTAIKEVKPQKTEYLGQNIPNPFTNTTTIPYYVPAGSKGFLQITDTKGELVDEYALQQGKNKLEISMVSYKAGVYFYSLVLDGVVVESKRMVFSNDY